MNIEVEIRSFLNKEKFNELLEFFKQEGKYLGEDYQETYYFDCEEDLRIQKNKNYSKIWLKKGKLHDDHREEIEVKFDTNYFDTLEKLFLGLGHNIEIKWFRTRHTFDWENLSVMLDYTKGYGYILELEKMSNEEEIGFHKGSLNTLVSERNELVKMIGNVEAILQAHVSRLKELGVEVNGK